MQGLAHDPMTSRFCHAIKKAEHPRKSRLFTFMTSHA
jgi:hypothetical protein